MAELIKHYAPFPEATSRAKAGQSVCPSRCTGYDTNLTYGCTREDGHPGQHEAGTPSGLKVASWI